jgi:serine/threonine protein kinase
LRVIGEGAYGQVFLAKNKANGDQFALKKLEKAFVLKHGKAYAVHRERDVLTKLTHPNIVRLDGTFQDQENLYFLMEYVPNGSLTEFIKTFSKCLSSPSFSTSAYGSVPFLCG